MKKIILYSFSLFVFNNQAQAFIDSWKILKNAEDMIEVLDTAQEVGETLEEDTPMIDQSRSELSGMRRDLKELGYTHDEIEELMAPYEFGGVVNTESIRKLNRHVQHLKRLNKRIFASSGLKGTPEGVVAKESMQTNVTLNNIHHELVMDRVIREKKETAQRRRELQVQIHEEKELKTEMELANEDSKKTLGFIFSPFKIAKAKEGN